MANVSVATSSRRKDRNTGETVEDTQWHRVTFYDRLAEIAGEYVKKGRPIYVEGRLKYGKYIDQAGVEKNTVDIVAPSYSCWAAAKAWAARRMAVTKAVHHRLPAAWHLPPHRALRPPHPHRARPRPRVPPVDSMTWTMTSRSDIHRHRQQKIATLGSLFYGQSY